jgi:multisubunit Na+/H+ antiporter MnhB subunit
MYTLLVFTLILMIAGSIYIMHAGDLLSAVISYGIVGFGLVICFMLLRAPDLAIIQIIIETITLIIMIAVILDSTRDEVEKGRKTVTLVTFLVAFVLIGGFTFFYINAIDGLQLFGDHTTRMSSVYIEKGVESTGSINLVTGVLLDFRGFDTLGEATILFTAAVGVLSVLRIRGKKN